MENLSQGGVTSRDADCGCFRIHLVSGATSIHYAVRVPRQILVGSRRRTRHGLFPWTTFRLVDAPGASRRGRVYQGTVHPGKQHRWSVAQSHSVFATSSHLAEPALRLFPRNPWPAHKPEVFALWSSCVAHSANSLLPRSTRVPRRMRVSLSRTRSPSPGKAYDSGLSKIFFLDLGPRHRRRRLVHRVQYWTNFAIVGSKINTRRNLLVVLRQKTQSHPNLFTFSLHALGLISFDSENSNSTASTLNGFDGARLLDHGTDIVTGESNESHFHR
jgi:hypothetical protein